MSTKLRCLLLDDEIPGLSFLKIICEQFPNLEVVKAYNNPELFVSEFEKLEFDFCILDIEMPHFNGLQIAKMIGNKPVIFTTAYKEYALEAFDVQAIDYIQKPVQKERLEKAIQKAQLLIQSSKQQKEFISVNTNKGKYLLHFKDIKYCTISLTDSRDKIVYLNDNKEIVLKNITFQKLLSSLPKSDFCRINKKDVIAIQYVDHFTLDEITLKSTPPITLQMSDVYRIEFIQKVN